MARIRVLNGEEVPFTPEEEAQADADEAADAAAQGVRRLSAVKAEAARRILARYPQYKQINAALGMYTPEYATAMVAYISAVRAASDAIELKLAADPYLDPATQPEWPL